jgi:DNA-binding IclR family transcriptional regulator
MAKPVAPAAEIAIDQPVRLVPAVARACAILDLLAQSREPAKIADIARALRLPRNSTYELIRTLLHLNMVQMDGPGRVRLGFHLFELGSTYAQSLDLIREARVVAREVALQCNETTHVAVLDGRDVIYLAKEEGSQPVRILSAVGRRIPAHGTAVGKAILASLPRSEVERRYRGVRLDQMTPNTLTDVRRFMGELDDAAERGHAIDHQESTPGVCCVGAPVRDDRGEVVAGISISVPSFRMTQKRERELAHLVSRAAGSLSKRLGHPTGP